MTFAKKRGRACIRPPIDDREAGVDVGLLRRHEAEVLDPRQPDVLDDEVELLVVGRHEVDVRDVEGVLVQRPDRRALVDVDVRDPELDALLEERRRLGIGELPAARAVVPLGRVELHALEAVLRVVLLELREPGLAVARVPAAVDDQPAGVLRGQRARCCSVVLKPSVYHSFRYVDWNIADVDVALLEDVLDEVLLGVLLELLERPVGLGRPQRPGRRGSTRSSPWRTAPRPSPSSSGLASQKWRWLSMTKYCSPSFSYMAPPYCDGLEVEVDVLGRVLRVGEHAARGRRARPCGRSAST